MALAIVLILTSILYLINRRTFIGKTLAQKIFKLIIYAACVLLSLFVILEILHIIKYHETSL